MEKQIIRIQTNILKPINQVWEKWTKPEHIVNWNFANDDWHCPSAENDLRVGGTFVYQMAAKDGSFSFGFGGTYDIVQPNTLISYTLGDGRKVSTQFLAVNYKETAIITDFEAESENPADMQQAGWQAILDNFRKYSEKSSQ